MFNQLIIIRGDFHQPRGGGTSDEQGELDTRIQDGHFTSLCGEHRYHQNLIFHVCINTTAIQTQKKKKNNTHINASSIHSINASHIHSLLNASYIFKRIIHSSHKTHRTFTHLNASSIHLINASHTHSPLNASSICKRIVHFFKKNQGAPSLGLHSRV